MIVAALGIVVSVLAAQAPADHIPIHAEELTSGARGLFTDDVSLQIRFW